MVNTSTRTYNHEDFLSEVGKNLKKKTRTTEGKYKSSHHKGKTGGKRVIILKRYERNHQKLIGAQKEIGGKSKNLFLRNVGKTEWEEVRKRRGDHQSVANPKKSMKKA